MLPCFEDSCLLGPCHAVVCTALSVVYAAVETLTGLFGGILSLWPLAKIENRGCASTRPGNAWIVFPRIESVFDRRLSFSFSI